MLKKQITTFLQIVRNVLCLIIHIMEKAGKYFKTTHIKMYINQKKTGYLRMKKECGRQCLILHILSFKPLSSPSLVKSPNYLSMFCLIFLKIYFLLKYSCFTEFCCFPSNLNMNQPQVFIDPLPFETSTCLPPHPTPLG